MAEVSMCSSESSTEPTAEEERILIRDIALAAESNAKDGDTFYLITQRWWKNWIEYVNQEQPNNPNDAVSLPEHCDSFGSYNSKKPTGIDNSDLVYDSASDESSAATEIHDTLLEGRDYVLLPQEVWNQLHSWYGGGPTLGRKVISSGLSQTELTVEVYPLRLQLVIMPKAECSSIRISKKETIEELHRRACEIFDLNMEQVRIWDYYGRRKHALMSDMDKTLDDANIQMDQDILVEVLNHGNDAIQKNGYLEKEATSILVEPSKSSLSIAGGLSASKGASKSYNITEPAAPAREPESTYGVSTRGYSGGLTGLLNLGNTCFMNSAIQCLVHTPEFAKYFREDYHPEINWKNPLGMVGELALAFGELLRKLWAPGRMPVAPRPFKAKLARFAPQFSGYNQHDSQELLAFLLDGLHEDLNRVKDKPYVKSKDADGRPDEEVADEYWANHIARNDSIIVDVCQGQYKSTLVCPVCNKVSVTFDPFMYLSLPLQSTITRNMNVMVFTCDGSALPIACTVTVPKQGRCRDLIQALSNACSLKPSEKLLLVEVRNNLILRFLEDPLVLLSTIKDDDHLVAYRSSKLLKNSRYLQLIHRRKELGASSSPKPYGTPLVLSISCEDVITRDDLQKMVCTILSPMRRSESRGNADVPNTRASAAASEPNDDPNESYLDENDLRLVDDKNELINMSEGNDRTIKFPESSTHPVIYIDWSQKLLKGYDTHYLENLPEVFKYGPVTKKPRNEPPSLYTCLEAFLREEPLVPEDMWFCPQCKERRQASKKLDLWRLPEVLVIHLKRFSYSRSMKHKLETFVNFPIHGFDLTNYIANKDNSHRQLYELYALTNHYGGMGSGHYTAHIKLLDESRWYNFDDSHISAINEDEVKSPAAYVLFYRRVKTEDATASNGETF